MHSNEQRIDLCNQALDGVRNIVSPELYKQISDDINRYNEWGLGIETLIDQLCELEIRIDSKQFIAIEAAMASMDLVDSPGVRYLRDHNLKT